MGFKGINFDATVSSYGRNLKAGTTGIFDQAKARFSSFVDGVKTSFQSAVKGDVIGIKVSAIPDMQGAIQHYVTTVQDALNAFAKETDTSAAFAGSHAEDIRKYVEAVSEACDNIVSNMLYFSDRLEAIKNAYNERNTKLSSEFQQNAADMKSQFEAYQTNSNVE